MAHFLHPILDFLSKFSDAPLFRPFTGTSTAPAWSTITYGTFANDVNRVALYWFEKLTHAGVESQNVVGLWVTGHHYSDLVLIYAVSRAGFIPEVFSASYQDQGAPVIRDILATTNGKALLFDISFIDDVKGLAMPCLPIPGLQTIPEPTVTLPSLPDVDLDDMALIFHTSGTTSGRPKPVPETHRWLRCHADIQWQEMWQGNFVGQDVFNNIGSFANVATATSMNHISRKGQCVVQTSRPDFGAEELLALIRECGLNRLLLYVPWLTNLLDIARKDDTVLNALKSMRQICYTGASLNPENEAWIMEKGIPATVMYASTELGPCLVSDINKPKSLPLLRVIPGLQLKLIKAVDLHSSDLNGKSEARARGGDLYDLFICDTSPNCPHPMVRNRPDGHSSGDLFEEVEPGFYAFRGRNDDWIRTGPHLLFCDTKSIEDNVLLKCADLVKDCTVVGHYKPALVLFVEPQPDAKVSTPVEVSAFKEELLKRIAPFNARLFSHERIEDDEHIVIASSGSLVRGGEKSNIRRKGVEEKNKDILERIYSTPKITT